MTNGGFSRRGRGAFFHWGVHQFGRREKTGASIEGEGCLLSLGCEPVWKASLSITNNNNNNKIQGLLFIMYININYAELHPECISQTKVA